MDKNVTNNTLKIIPLGGLHEIGKNTCIFEYGDEIVLLDAGIGFPTDGMHGVNVVLPDMTYLLENRHKIKGMIVTHGHEDHIGGIAYHLKQFDIPAIYGPRLAMALLRDKLSEAGVLDRTQLQNVQPRDTVQLSPSFKVEYIRNTHSIADSCSVAIQTPLGVVIHTGDFKIDHTPVDGEFFDLQRLAEYGDAGVLCLLSDSTNAEVPGHTPSEQSVAPNLDRIFRQVTGRLFVTTFASSVHRLNIVLRLAQQHNRKVVVVGRSMLNVIAHARKLGYIKCPDNLFVPLKNLASLPDEQVLILTTGSQGEELAAMTRISSGSHRQVTIKPGDTVVFSANPIPGNTLAVVDTIDRLMMRGADVIYGRHQGIHVSGHGAQEDHKLMLALTRPKFFVPVHGQYRMLVEHARMAHRMGIPEDHTVVINNGDIVEVSRDRIQIAGQVPSGIKLVDGSGIIHDQVMKERQQLAEDGVFTIAAAVNTELQLVAQPAVHLRGVAQPIERNLLQQVAIRTLERVLRDRGPEFAHANNGEGPVVDWEGLKRELEEQFERLARRELNCRPLVVFLLQTPLADDSPRTTTTSSRRRRRSTASVAS